MPDDNTSQKHRDTSTFNTAVFLPIPVYRASLRCDHIVQRQTEKYRWDGM